MSDTTLPLVDQLVEFGELSSFGGADLQDLCDATEATLADTDGPTLGFNSEVGASRERLESYWKGVLLVPDRTLIVGRIDGVIAGSIQLVRSSLGGGQPGFAASVEHHFVAPWARGNGLAKGLLRKAEAISRDGGVQLLKLSVRSTQSAAVHLYEVMGYGRWGVLDKYEKVDGRFVSGYFYCKDLGEGAV